MSPKAESIQWDRNTSFLLKGSPGFGKTIAACSAAIYGDVFLAYIDKRAPVELLAFFKKHRPELLSRIEYESYGSNNINEYLNKLIKFQEDGCKYAAVITDSVTSLTSSAVNWSMGFRDPKGGKKDKVANNTPQIIPDWDEYKVETSLVTQALDICKTLNVINIWTAHPLPSIKVEGSGKVDSVTKTSSIVSYGAKVGALVPGAFSEVYHFGRQMNKRIVWTDMVGDDFARTSLNLPKSFDITDKLFFEVWEELVREGMNEGGMHEVKDDISVVSNPNNPNPFDRGGNAGNVIGINSKWKV